MVSDNISTIKVIQTKQSLQDRLRSTMSFAKRINIYFTIKRLWQLMQSSIKKEIPINFHSKASIANFLKHLQVLVVLKEKMLSLVVGDVEFIMVTLKPNSLSNGLQPQWPIKT